MKAEERYGSGKYICASPSSLVLSPCFFTQLLADVGNGTFEPGPNTQPFGAQAPYQRGYGATGGGP